MPSFQFVSLFSLCNGFPSNIISHLHSCGVFLKCIAMLSCIYNCGICITTINDLLFTSSISSAWITVPPNDLSILYLFDFTLLRLLISIFSHQISMCGIFETDNSHDLPSFWAKKIVLILVKNDDEDIIQDLYSSNSEDILDPEDALDSESHQQSFHSRSRMDCSSHSFFACSWLFNFHLIHVPL